jgi:energy-coupling factor transporter ATP-binding protein EcfA2
MSTERFADLAAEIGRRPARLGSVRLVAVDGPSGSGKTTFARRLAAALGQAGSAVELVHTDDLLDGWEDQFTFWPRLERGVLEPLARGEPGRYRIYDWVRGCFGGNLYVPVPDVLIVEGATSARAEAYLRLTLSVFVTADRDLRIRRALARDGPAIEVPLRRWMAAEDDYFAGAGTVDRVDRVVDGVARVGHDPECEYVRLR